MVFAIITNFYSEEENRRLINLPMIGIKLIDTKREPKMTPVVTPSCVNTAQVSSESSLDDSS